MERLGLEHSRNTPPMPRLLPATVLIAIGLALNGCGVRGALDPPPGAKSETATAESGQGKAQGEAPKPHRPSVFDPLLK